MKDRDTLRNRIVLLVLAAIVPLVGLSIGKALINASAEIDRATSRLEFAASLVASSQQRVADSAHQMLRAIVNVPGLLALPNAQCQDYFNTLNAQMLVYANMGIVGVDGRFRCDGVVNQPVYVGYRDFFKAAIASRDFVAGQFMLGAANQRPLINFALPVMDGQDKVLAVAFVGVDTAELSRMVTEVPLPPNSHLVITDRQGLVLAVSPDRLAEVGQQVPDALLQTAVKVLRKGVREGQDTQGVSRIYAFEPVGQAASPAFFVALSVTRADVVAPVQQQLMLELLVMGLVALLGGWIAWMMGGRAIVQPAAEILSAARQLQQGRLDVRVALRRADSRSELTRIAEGFNQMASALQRRSQELDAELARSYGGQATLTLTINSMQEGLVAVDRAGRPMLVNQAATRLFALDGDLSVLSDAWPQRLGLYLPGTHTLYAFDQLPLHRALQGESGGPLHILVRNAAVPEGRLISCSYRPMQGTGQMVGALMLFSDITELEQLQLAQASSNQALRETQRKLLDAQRLGHIGNWEFDLQSGQLWWSDEVYALYGLKPGAAPVTADGVIQMMHPDDRQRYLTGYQCAAQDGHEFDVEFRITTPGGEVRWMHQLCQSRVDDRGRTTHRVGVTQDITARKKSELAVARNNELLNRTGEMAKIGGWELLLDRMVFVCSDEVYRIHEVARAGYTPFEQAMGFYPPEAQPVIRAAMRAGIDQGKPWDLILPIITAKGRRLQIRVQGRALLHEGKTVRLLGAFQDVTEQMQAEEQLRLLETSVSRLNDMVVITEAEPLDDPGPRILFVNDAFVRRTGYSRAEVLGKSPRLLQGPQTSRAELDRIGAALRKWQPVRSELINYTKTGEAFWIELDIVPVADAKGWYTHWVAVERDVTERKRAEAALLESERRYAALFDTAPVPMWIVDDHSQRFMAVNQACIDRYGYSRAELLRMTIFDIRSECEAQRLKAEIASGVAHAVNRRLHQAMNGQEFHVETVSRQILHDGRASRLVVAFDISAQIAAEQHQQEYLYTLQRAADAAQAITWHQTLGGTMQEVADQARGVICAHQALVILSSGSEDQWSLAIHGMSLSDKYARYRQLADAPDGSGIYALVCETNRPLRLTQAELEAHPRWRGFGSYATHHPAMRGWLAVPLVGRSGKNIGLLQLSDKYEGEFTQQDEYVALELAQLASIAIENTQLLEQVNQLNAGLEQKVAERTAALSRQEALFRALAERAPQAVWTADPQGGATYYNRAWYELVGGQFEDWAGNRWLTAVHPEDVSSVKASWQQAQDSQSQYENIRRLRALDGSYHTMSSRASPVFDERGELAYWVGIDADITEIKAIEAALRLSNEELEAFSYSVSHDLRSPLNTIDGFSRLLSKQLMAGNAGEKGQHYLARIQAGVAQMGQLIEDLLALAHVARTQLRRERLDLSVLALGVLAELHARHPERKVSLQVDSGLLAHGDGRLLKVVMENLLGNAWKFSSQQSLASISVGQQRDTAGGAVFFVRDNGAGFDMAYADKLFNPFQRLHAASEFPGTGIGLATVSRVISRHGGRLWAESSPGQGATFFFTLPQMAVAL